MKNSILPFLLGMILLWQPAKIGFTDPVCSTCDTPVPQKKLLENKILSDSLDLKGKKILALLNEKKTDTVKIFTEKIIYVVEKRKVSTNIVTDQPPFKGRWVMNFRTKNEISEVPVLTLNDNLKLKHKK